ncbi:MAG: lactonase family protein, partial [Desulfocucumaceae bacterium]
MRNHFRFTAIIMLFTALTFSACDTGSKEKQDSSNPKYFVYVINESGTNTVCAYSIGNDGILSLVTGTLAGSTYATGSWPKSMTTDISGKYLYVANSEENNISAFSIGTTGELTAIGTYTTSYAPGFIVASPSGKYIYASNSSSNTVFAYLIGTSGALTPVTGNLTTSSYTTGNGPVFLAVDPTGKYLYSANYSASTISAFSIGSDGGLTSLGSDLTTGTNPKTVRIDPSGKYVYVSAVMEKTIRAYSIESTGTLTAVTGTSTYSNFISSLYILDLAINPAGNYLFKIEGASICGYYINAA